MVDKADMDLKEAPEAETEDASVDTGGADKPEASGSDGGKQGGGKAASLSGSVLDGVDDGDDDAGGDGDKVAHPADFPEDWRQKLAGDNEKELAMLQRMKSPADVWKAYRAIQQKMSSGELISTLPEDATEDEVSAWRKANGVPESPGDYKIPEIKDYQWNEADESLISEFLQDAHKDGFPQKVVDSALKSVARLQQQQLQRIAEFDATNKERMEDELRTELGTEYRPRLKRIGRVLNDPEAFPDGIGPLIAAARDPNGVRLVDNPSFFRWLDSYAELYKGESGLVSAEDVSAMTSREEEIVKIMKSNLDEYYEKGLDKELQEIRDRKSGGRKR